MTLFRTISRTGYCSISLNVNEREERVTHTGDYATFYASRPPFHGPTSRPPPHCLHHMVPASRSPPHGPRLTVPASRLPPHGPRLTVSASRPPPTSRPPPHGSRLMVKRSTDHTVRGKYQGHRGQAICSQQLQER